MVGKVGPALIWDHTDRAGMRTVVIDDSTGTPSGIPLAPDTTEAMKKAGLPLIATSRGDNGRTGTVTIPGTTASNVAQQAYFVDVVTKADVEDTRQALRIGVLVSGPGWHAAQRG